MFQISPLDSAQYKKGIPVNRKVKQRENKTIPKETPSIHTQEIKPSKQQENQAKITTFKPQL
jgi:hypothetical protein